MRYVLLSLLLPLFCCSFSCLTCDGDDCLSPERWITEHCQPAVNQCYRLIASGKVFRRGCAISDCYGLPGIPFGATCNTCDSSNCNGLRQAYLDHPGGGGVWKSSSPIGISGSLSLLTVYYFRL